LFLKSEKKGILAGGEGKRCGERAREMKEISVNLGGFEVETPMATDDWP
jgi:hypothetical protein